MGFKWHGRVYMIADGRSTSSTQIRDDNQKIHRFGLRFYIANSGKKHYNLHIIEALKAAYRFQNKDPVSMQEVMDFVSDKVRESDKSPRLAIFIVAGTCNGSMKLMELKIKINEDGTAQVTANLDQRFALGGSGGVFVDGHKLSRDISSRNILQSDIRKILVSAVRRVYDKTETCGGRIHWISFNAEEVTTVVHNEEEEIIHQVTAPIQDGWPTE